jgi:hypothetical protein
MVPLLRKGKNLSNSLIIHMFFEGKPMSEYGNMGKLLLLFDVQTFPKIIGQIQQVGYG